MNVLYKYCDQLGIVKILESLELKLPCISEVNDPLELLPFLYCPNDNDAMEAQCLRTFNRNNISPPANWKQKLYEQIKTGEFRENLTKGLREHLYDMRQGTFLLSVSKKKRSTVMWAHYADKHKGAIIGIDFDRIFPKYGIKMHAVDYSGRRPQINLLHDISTEEWRNTLSTKSSEWEYEQEFRMIIGDVYLMDLEQQGLACLKDFNGKKTWFLRLNPESIREVVFGLYTENSLKSAIAKLVERPELKHIKLYQTEESETYTLNLVDIKSKIK